MYWISYAKTRTCIIAPGRSFVQWSPKQLITKSTELHKQNVSLGYIQRVPLLMSSTEENAQDINKLLDILALSVILIWFQQDAEEAYIPLKVFQTKTKKGIPFLYWQEFFITNHEERLNAVVRHICLSISTEFYCVI